MTGTALLLILIVIIIMIVFKSGVFVPENSAYVIERLGRFNKVVGTGFHVATPFIERVAYRRTLLPEPLKLPTLALKTADGCELSINAVITLKVAGVEASCYNVDNYKQRASEAAITILQEIAATFTLETFAAEKVQMEINLQNQLAQNTSPWGVEITGFEITLLTDK